MEHALGHTSSFNKFQRTKSIQFIFYDHNAIKLEVSNEKICGKSPNIQMLNTILQNNLNKKRNHKKILEQSLHKGGQSNNQLANKIQICAQSYLYKKLYNSGHLINMLKLQ